MLSHVAVSISLEEFNAIIDTTLATLPAPFRAFLEYTLIVIDEGAPGGLYGLYHGAPATIDPTPGRLNTITLYWHTMEAHARDLAALREQVRKTLLHEIGHHLGLNEQEVSTASYPPSPA
jgi:predicted Zn-dependent protease with MMP-like domain